MIILNDFNEDSCITNNVGSQQWYYKMVILKKISAVYY